MIRIAIGISLCLLVASVLGADEAAMDETPIEDYERDHWSYDPIVSPTVPTVKHLNWPSGSIDRFVLAELETRSLAPMAKANRTTLLRRVTFDVTGLPPTPEEIEAFAKDVRPHAYERMVDRLLASPQYGRRWGQFWLDLARFAETDGFEHDKIRPTAWKYRDWVIQAFCDDMPFDQFVKMQVAGDMIRPDDPQAAIATAFCLSGPDMPDINSQEERKHVLLNEITSTVGSVFLSLQVGCAQCHDHKYDSISQADFYRLRAFFEPAIKLKANKSVTTLVADSDSDATPRIYERGDWRRPGAKVQPAAPRVLSEKSNGVRTRKDLANWLTSPTNPLVARSIVNRIWQFHFGRGLSSTPSDFGVVGSMPSHPELLDYLASQLITDAWSLKRLHRSILLSSTYQTTSVAPADAETRRSWDRSRELDPENRWLSRFPRRRLDAESIRDSMFAASGSLNHQAGGPGVSPPLPIELVKTLKSGQWKVTPRVADHYRRSIYLFSRRNLRYPMFATFDRPAANCSCAVRHESTTAIQSLMLLNSKISLDAAERLVHRVRRDQVHIDESCRDLFRRLLARDPDPEELRECESFVAGQARLLNEADPQRAEEAALVDLCLALLNSNEFLYVD